MTAHRLGGLEAALLQPPPGQRRGQRPTQGQGVDSFAKGLRREYGISLLLDPSPDQLNRAHGQRDKITAGKLAFAKLGPLGAVPIDDVA